MCVLACWHVFWSRPAVSHGTLCSAFYLSSPSLFLHPPPISFPPLLPWPAHSHVPCKHTHRRPNKTEEVVQTLLLTASHSNKHTSVSFCSPTLKVGCLIWSSLTLKKVTFLYFLSLSQKSHRQSEEGVLWSRSADLLTAAQLTKTTRDRRSSPQTPTLLRTAHAMLSNPPMGF